MSEAASGSRVRYLDYAILAYLDELYESRPPDSARAVLAAQSPELTASLTLAEQYRHQICVARNALQRVLDDTPTYEPFEGAAQALRAVLKELKA
jgi:hypothetical protein